MAYKRVLVISPYFRDPNSLWRCMGPWNYLDKHYRDELQIHPHLRSDGCAWDDIDRFDLIFLHRPCRPDDLTVMKLAKVRRIPVWIDYDDWLFGLPAWNPHQKFYSSVQTQTIMAHCIATADCVSVTTDALYQLFKTINPNTVIVPNAYNVKMEEHYRRAPLPPRNHTIFWRGSDTHDADLLSIKEGLQNLPAPIGFLGRPSWLVLSGMKEGSFSLLQSQDPTLFNRYVYDLKPKAVVVPLVDCFFNRCKSNIAYIEALHAGAICVAPEMPEWRREGVVTYKPHDSQDFLKAVTQVMDLSQEEHEAIVNPAFESMKANYSMESIAAQRKYLVEQLTSKDYTLNEKSPFDQTLGLSTLSQIRSYGKEPKQQTA